VSDCGNERGRAKPERTLVHPGPEGRGRTLLAACAALVFALALGVPGSGCLNPRPEELPSGSGSDSPLYGLEASGPTPMRQTCEDNPLLAGCDLPETDINEEPNANAGATPEVPEEASPGASDPALTGTDDMDAPAGGAAVGDAGSPDAGAP
jgi:hypothetical protein